MASLFNRLSVIPAFPEYTGPYDVGTVDIEFSVDDLEAPSSAPREDIATVQYRIFYPCQPEKKSKNIHWIPSPQRGYVSAYTRFLGYGNYLAEFISFFPRILHYIKIPVHKNAPLLKAETSDGRWPVMIFSHGLAGSRNAYSHLVGSIASHGIIVIAPEHRDGSAPISFIRDVPLVTPIGDVSALGEKPPTKFGKNFVDYCRFPHTPSPEVEEGRNNQLKTRLWELGLVHDSVLKVDEGLQPDNLNPSCISLAMFRNQMDVHTPGKIIFTGHSFGSATIAQFVKSTFYAPQNHQAPPEYQPLFTPSSRSSIAQQITSQTPVILLDVWCMPLRAKSTRWLWDKPFPCYSEDGAGGDALLAVESQTFFKWRENLKATKLLLSADPFSEEFEYTRKDGKGEFSQPHFYYVETAAHLSQSDFGILFQWWIKKFLAVEEPERIMRLNVRAILQLIRSQKIEISQTSAADMELDGTAGGDTMNDIKIFGRNNEVRAWKCADTDVTEMKDVNMDSVPVTSKQQSSPDVKTTEPVKPVVPKDLMKGNSRR